MGFNSDLAGANQAITTINLPSVKDQVLFEDRLEELLRTMSTILNTKEGGLHDLKELITFKQFFTINNPQKFRNVYRTCYDLVDLNGGNITSGATVSFAHNISNLEDAILIYISCVTTTSEYFTAVYPDIFLTATNISFTNPHAAAVSSAIAVADYTRA